MSLASKVWYSLVDNRFDEPAKRLQAEHGGAFDVTFIKVRYALSERAYPKSHAGPPTRQPGCLATRQPGNTATLQLGNPATRRLHGYPGGHGHGHGLPGSRVAG